MVTEAWVQSAGHRGRVSSAHSSGAGGGDQEAAGCRKGSNFKGNIASTEISSSPSGENSCSNGQKGNTCYSSILFSSLIDKYAIRCVRISNSRRESHRQVAAERKVRFMQFGNVFNKEKVVKTRAKSIKPNIISASSKTEISLRPETKDTMSSDHLNKVRPQNAIVVEEPLLLSVLTLTPNTESVKHGESCHKKSKGKDGGNIMCGKTGTALRPDTENTSPNEDNVKVRPKSAEVTEEPLLLGMLRNSPNTEPLKHDDSYKQGHENNARGTRCEKSETTSQPNTTYATNSHSHSGVRPQSADVIQMPLLNEVLTDASKVESLQRKDGNSCKQIEANEAQSMLCGGRSSVIDMQGDPWDTNTGTNFTKLTRYKTPKKIQSGKDNKNVISSKTQNSKSQSKSGYSERYGIDSKYCPPLTRDSRSGDVQQRATQSGYWNVRADSTNSQNKMTATAGFGRRRQTMICRRASDINILQRHIKAPNTILKEDDSCLTSDSQSWLPIMKGKQPWKNLSDMAPSDQPLTWKGFSPSKVDDVNNNREHRFQYGDEQWTTQESATKDCTRGHTIILGVTPGAKLKHGPLGVQPVHWLGSNSHKPDPLQIRGFRSHAEDEGTEAAVSYWCTVKQAIQRGLRRSSSASLAIEQRVERSASVRPQQLDSSKVKRPATQNTVSRKPDKPQQPDTKNMSTEGDAEPQAAATSLIEDPILVKVSKRNRNVGKFTCKPDPMPNAVCFEIPGTELRHQDVKLQVESLLRTYPEVKIIGIQFHNRALVNNQRDMNNRWIITTNTDVGCNLLVGNCLSFDGHEVQLRLYDEVIRTEYQQFVRMTNFVKMMDTRKILS
ncbi:hypothetical protein BsWGS_12839 [Bradybaena similaris]